MCSSAQWSRDFETCELYVTQSQKLKLQILQPILYAPNICLQYCINANTDQFLFGGGASDDDRYSIKKMGAAGAASLYGAAAMLVALLVTLSINRKEAQQDMEDNQPQASGPH